MRTGSPASPTRAESSPHGKSNTTEYVSTARSAVEPRASLLGNGLQGSTPPPRSSPSRGRRKDEQQQPTNRPNVGYDWTKLGGTVKAKVIDAMWSDQNDRDRLLMAGEW